MTARTSTLLKLFVLCALLWVQALQVDHVTDQTLDNQHIDCLVCKSIGDAAPGGDTIALSTTPEFNEALANNYDVQPVTRGLYNTPPARGPPVKS